MKSIDYITHIYVFVVYAFGNAINLVLCSFARGVRWGIIYYIYHLDSEQQRRCQISAG